MASSLRFNASSLAIINRKLLFTDFVLNALHLSQSVYCVINGIRFVLRLINRYIRILVAQLFVSFKLLVVTSSSSVAGCLH
jgi:hypothetical protein